MSKIKSLFFNLILFYLFFGVQLTKMDKTITSDDFQNVTLNQFKWFNEPKQWELISEELKVKTDNATDFWQTTWYNFTHHSGHVFGIDIKGDFTFTVSLL